MHFFNLTIEPDHHFSYGDFELIYIGSANYVPSVQELQRIGNDIISEIFPDSHEELLKETFLDCERDKYRCFTLIVSSNPPWEDDPYDIVAIFPWRNFGERDILPPYTRTIKDILKNQ